MGQPSTVSLIFLMPLLGQILTAVYVQNFRLPALTSDFGYGHLLIFYLFGADWGGRLQSELGISLLTRDCLFVR